MKSRAKVIQQKHIREIPQLMHALPGFNMQHGLGNFQEDQLKKRQKRQNKIKNLSRKMNRNSN